MSLNRIMDSMGYSTLGEFLRDIVRQKIDVGNEPLERFTSREEKVNLLYIGRGTSKITEDSNPTQF